MQKYMFLVCGGLIAIGLSGCSSDNTAKSSWEDVVKKCSVNDLTGSNILYFGPSNNLGPGSIWRQPQTGGYRLRFSLTDMPDPKTFVTQGVNSNCSGSATENFDLNAGANLTAATAPISAGISNDFKNAKNVQVTAQSMAWDTVHEGVYESYVDKLAPDNPIRQDLDKGDRLVLYTALRVHGFSAQMEFSSGDAASLQAKYQGNIAKALAGDLGANLSANWSAGNKLTLTSSDDFYIAGILEPYNKNGFAGAKPSAFGQPVTISKSAPLGRDPIQ